MRSWQLRRAKHKTKQKKKKINPKLGLEIGVRIFA